MNEEALRAFDEMILAVCSAADFSEAWRLYQDKKGRSADAITSLAWTSKAPVPRALSRLAGSPTARTYGELAQEIRDWGRPNSPQDRYTPKIDK